MKVSREAQDTVAGVLRAVGVDPAVVDAEAWKWQPDTRYFRYNKFVLNEDGSRTPNYLRREAQRLEAKVKIPRGLAEVLNGVLS